MLRYLPYPPAQYLVDGSGLLERALGHNLWPHLLHVEHEGVQGLLDVAVPTARIKAENKRNRGWT